MTGWTPVPDKLKDRLFCLAKVHDKKAALELYLLAQTCRRAGWDGLMPGQVRITESQVAEIVGTNRSYAHRLLESVMAETGLERHKPGILEWRQGAEKGAAQATQNTLKNKGENETEGAEKGAEKGAASITILQESKRDTLTRCARLSEEDEKTIENGLVILKGIYPTKYHDGAPSPHYSQSLTRDRIRKLSATFPVFDLLMAIERYYESSKSIYFKAPQNFLGPKGPYRDYLEAV